jgi:hypothetical protein
MSVTKLPHKRGGGGNYSELDTVLISQKMIEDWLDPKNRAPFQRIPQVTPKIKELAERIRDDSGVIDGVLTFGTLRGAEKLYVIDGQHRLLAAQLSGLSEFIADARTVNFDNMVEMGKEFVLLNTALRRMAPDDILRALEASMPTLSKLRAECPFIDYGKVRRKGTESTVLGMSPTLRCWKMSQGETPAPGAASGMSVLDIAIGLDDTSIDELIHFLQIARHAWGDDQEYKRLWSGLNLTVCMWLWNRISREPPSAGRHTKRYIKFNDAQFTKALMSLSAETQEGGYIDWLGGRTMTERDRGPCYARIKKVITSRFKDDAPGFEIKFPSGPWVTK